MLKAGLEAVVIPDASVRWFTWEELRRAVERWDEDEALRVPPPLTIAHQLARAWLVEHSGSE